MNWKEFVQELKGLPTDEKIELVLYTCAILGSTVLIILGTKQTLEYIDQVSLEIKYAIGGVYIACMGVFCWMVTLWKSNCRSRDRLDKRIEKLEGKD